MLKLLKALDVVLHTFTPRAWTRATERVRRGHDGRVRSGGWNIVVMTADCIENGLVFFVVALGEIHANCGMSALNFVIHGFTNVMQETSAPRHGSIKAKLIRNQLAQERNLNGVAQDILSVARSIVKPTHHFNHLHMQPRHTRFHSGVVARFHHALVNIVARLLDHFFNARRMHAAIGHKSLQRFNSNGLAHAVKATNGNHARRVVDENIHASGSFKCPNVAALATNDAALEIIGRNFHGANCGISGRLAAVALHSHERDLAGILARLQLRLFDYFVLQQCGIALAEVAHFLHELLARLFLRQAAYFGQALAGLLQRSLIFFQHQLLFCLCFLQGLSAFFKCALAVLKLLRALLHGNFAAAYTLLRVLGFGQRLRNLLVGGGAAVGDTSLGFKFKSARFGRAFHARFLNQLFAFAFHALQLARGKRPHGNNRRDRNHNNGDRNERGGIESRISGRNRRKLRRENHR